MCRSGLWSSPRSAELRCRCDVTPGHFCRGLRWLAVAVARSGSFGWLRQGGTGLKRLLHAQLQSAKKQTAASQALLRRSWRGLLRPFRPVARHVISQPSGEGGAEGGESGDFQLFEGAKDEIYKLSLQKWKMGEIVVVRIGKCPYRREKADFVLRSFEPLENGGFSSFGPPSGLLRTPGKWRFSSFGRLG